MNRHSAAAGEAIVVHLAYWPQRKVRQAALTYPRPAGVTFCCCGRHARGKTASPSTDQLSSRVPQGGVENTTDILDRYGELASEVAKSLGRPIPGYAAERLQEQPQRKPSRSMARRIASQT